MELYRKWKVYLFQIFNLNGWISSTVTLLLFWHSLWGSRKLCEALSQTTILGWKPGIWLVFHSFTQEGTGRKKEKKPKSSMFYIQIWQFKHATIWFNVLFAYTPIFNFIFNLSIANISIPQVTEVKENMTLGSTLVTNPKGGFLVSKYLLRQIKNNMPYLL